VIVVNFAEPRKPRTRTEGIKAEIGIVRGIEIEVDGIEAGLTLDPGLGIGIVGVRKKTEKRKSQRRRRRKKGGKRRKKADLMKCHLSPLHKLVLYLFSAQG
jgi:hypothetical protein